MAVRLKSIAKRIIVPMLHQLRFYEQIITRNHHHKVVVLCGHRISRAALSPEDALPLSFETGVTNLRFDRLVQFLKEEMNPISLEDLVFFLKGEVDVPERAVTIMFDDGYMDNYLNAFPILKRYQVPATIFLATGHVDTDTVFWWDRVGEVIKRTRIRKLEMAEIKGIIGANLERLPDVILLGTLYHKNKAWQILTSALRSCRPAEVMEVIGVLENRLEVNSDAYRHLHLALTWDQIGQMSRHGIEFGAHTVSHPLLSRLPLVDFQMEVLGSKQAIEAHIGKPVSAFAYPYGELPNPISDAKAMLSSNGFRCAFMFEEGYVSKASDPFELKRIGIDNVPVGIIVRELAAVLREGRN